MRIRQIAFFLLLSLCLTVVYAWAIPIDKYVKQRVELEAADYSLSVVIGAPGNFRGRVTELRGSISGVASVGEISRIIIQCGTDHQIVICDSNAAPPSGALVALLAVIGEGSETSLSDLRLVSWCFDSELKSWEAAATEQTKTKLKYTEKPQTARETRRERPTSRKYDYSDVTEAYRKAISSYNPKLSRREAKKITDAILGFSIKYEVDPRLVVALVLAESHFRPEATSSKGAMGLGQLMPGTARGLGVGNAYDPEQNLAGAIKLIKGHLDKQSGKAAYGDLTWQDLELALASYNAGAGAVKKYGGIPPYRETRNYVQRVVKYYKKLCGISD